MLIETQGIVLRCLKFSDHSLIVKIYTEMRGTVTFIVKNAYNRKSALRASLFSPLALLELTYHEHPNRDLNYIKVLSRLDSPCNLPFDPAVNALFMFYNELLYKLLGDAGQDPVLFHFLKHELLRITDGQTGLTDLPLRFLIRLSVILGFSPENNYSEEDCYFSLSESRFQSFFTDDRNDVPQKESLYLSRLLRDAPPDSIERETRNRLLHYLIEYYKLHNEQIKSVESLDILSGILH